MLAAMDIAHESTGTTADIGIPDNALFGYLIRAQASDTIRCWAERAVLYTILSCHAILYLIQLFIDMLNIISFWSSSKSLLANVLDIDDDFRHNCRPMTPGGTLPHNPAFYRTVYG